MGQPTGHVPQLGGSTDPVAAVASYGLVMTETVAAPAHETVWSLTNAVVPAACLHCDRRDSASPTGSTNRPRWTTWRSAAPWTRRRSTACCDCS